MNNPHKFDASQNAGENFDALELEMRRLKPLAEAFDVRDEEIWELDRSLRVSSPFRSRVRWPARAGIVALMAAAACFVIAVARWRVQPRNPATDVRLLGSSEPVGDGLNDAEMSIAAYMKVAGISPDALERMLESQAMHIRPASEVRPLSVARAGI